MAETKAFVAGWPIEHSRSPLIHNHWLKAHGINGSYAPIAVAPDDLADFVGGLRAGDYAGGNITLPHKTSIMPLLDRIEPIAETIGAVNTVWLEGGELCGGNTDAYGFAANLDERASGWAATGGPALVLGAGGAARAIVHALIERGMAPLFIANRTLSNAQALADRFGGPCIACSLTDLPDEAHAARLIVNTTSIGMGDGQSPICLDGFGPDSIVSDIVYAPLMTPFLADARSRGMRIVDGLGMLLHQAVPGFERWFGTRPDVTAGLRDRLLADLGEKA